MRYILAAISLFLFFNCYSQTETTHGTIQVKKKGGVFDRAEYGNFSPVDTFNVDGKVFRIILSDKYKCPLFPKFMGSKLVLCNNKNVWSDHYVISYIIGVLVNGAYAEVPYFNNPPLDQEFSNINSVGTKIYISSMKSSTVDEKKMSIPESTIVRIK